MVHVLALSTLGIALAAMIGCGGVGDKPAAVGPEAADGPAPIKAEAGGKARVIIGFKRPPGKNETALVQAQGGKVTRVYHLIPAIAATIPQQAVAALQRNPNVDYVEGDPEAKAFEYYGEQPTPETVDWGVDRIDADMVWDTDGDLMVDPGADVGSGVKVAIVDTGINGPAVGSAGPDPTGPHPDLEINVAGGTNIVNDVAEQAHDDNGHGTHVAGIVGSAANGFGNIGVAPGVSLYSVKVLGADGSGYYSWVIAGLEWCADNGMDVANMSLGGPFRSRSLQKACNNAYKAGVLLVAAAGNDGGRVSYPARYDSVIAVSASDASDQLYVYSNTGSEIELCGPGVAVWSTCDQWLDGSDYDGDDALDGYAILTGTSMAAPHVTGVAALVIASGVTGPDPVRARLQETAEDLGSPGRDTSFGYGLVDAQAAVSGGPPPPPPSGTMHVASIDMSLRQRGPWTNAKANVTVLDEGDNPVPDATVAAHWENAATDSDSGTTAGDGSVTFQSDRTRATSGTFTFVVDTVTKSGWTYDSAGSVTSNSISF
ncbi:MAG: S8 family peptidase [Armatimonadota bacterium]